MIDNVLYIIENGFDMHHHVASSYGDFRNWLRRNDAELFNVYSTVCRYDALWSDFENGLAYVDRDYFIAGADLFLPDYNTDPDDWQMADILMAGDWARSFANELIENLKTAFYKWVKSLRTPPNYDDFKVRLDYEARFLTFNYTNYLESEYGIDQSQVRYIHSSRRAGSKSLVIGHGGDDEAFHEWWKSKRYNKPRYDKKGRRYFKRDSAWKTYRSQLSEYEGIAEGLQDYYEESRKPVERILTANDDYFSDLYDIEIIYALGFSFNKIDVPYIKRIIDSNDNPQKIRWHVSYYNDEEKGRLKQRLSTLDIDVDSSIEFLRLSDLQSTR